MCSYFRSSSVSTSSNRVQLLWVIANPVHHLSIMPPAVYEYDCAKCTRGGRTEPKVSYRTFTPDELSS
ncbi:hypothetical protein CPC08DRAFT_465853 [Agrocybe pediades]|nr:hypothetical protein CPC08DRAFT_465853 [Agrocybe pediades]